MKTCSHYRPAAQMQMTLVIDIIYALVELKVAYSEKWTTVLCLSGSKQCPKCAFVTNFALCTQEVSVVCGREWDYSTLCAAELTGLRSFQKTHDQKPTYIHHWSTFCKWNIFQGHYPLLVFHLWEVFFFHRESIFSSQISSGGPYSLKISSWGTNFWVHDRLLCYTKSSLTLSVL